MIKLQSISAIFAEKTAKKRCAQGQSRTVYTRIFSPLLYQLSYLGGMAGLCIRKFAAGQQSVCPPGPALPCPHARETAGGVGAGARRTFASTRSQGIQNR